jgi:hypothetical protein
MVLALFLMAPGLPGPTRQGNLTIAGWRSHP